MRILRTAAISILVCEMAFAFQVPEDPVLKARTQRAQAQGISDGDLPPVPRAIAEPPPLPAPETNYKDTRKGRSVRASRSSRAKKGRRTTSRATKSRVHASVTHRTKKHR
ncbi:MAG: hypothetical protein IPP78_04950 [Holophagaceae bacterium]|nr:hypothetical protein [Holophagaceae bacterium]